MIPFFVTLLVGLIAIKSVEASASSSEQKPLSLAINNNNNNNNKNKNNSSQIYITSFNIRMGTANDGSNSWPTRSEHCISIIGRYHIAGLQEALLFQNEEILQGNPHMRYIGVGRDDGVDEGEFSPIFYDASRFQVLEQGTFWFCDKPDEPGCKSYGNSIPRICTWGLFADNSNNGAIFYVYNVHLDHQSQNSREMSVKQLLDTISKRNVQPTPVVVTGDFNNGEQSPEILSMKQSYDDAFRLICPECTNVGTFNSWVGATTGPKIDYVFTAKQNNTNALSVLVDDATIVYDNIDGKYPSDHYPVDALFRLA
jgi:endonuclease/exonuclease/phosphatase family metal-dependent hydrolase